MRSIIKPAHMKMSADFADYILQIDNRNSQFVSSHRTQRAISSTCLFSTITDVGIESVYRHESQELPLDLDYFRKVRVPDHCPKASIWVFSPHIGRASPALQHFLSLPTLRPRAFTGSAHRACVNLGRFGKILRLHLRQKPPLQHRDCS